MKGSHILDYDYDDHDCTVVVGRSKAAHDLSPLTSRRARDCTLYTGLASGLGVKGQTLVL